MRAARRDTYRLKAHLVTYAVMLLAYAADADDLYNDDFIAKITYTFPEKATLAVYRAMLGLINDLQQI